MGLLIGGEERGRKAVLGDFVDAQNILGRVTCNLFFSITRIPQVEQLPSNMVVKTSFLP